MLQALTPRQYDRLKVLVGRRLDKAGSLERRKLIKRCKMLGQGCGRRALLVRVRGFKPVVFKYAHINTMGLVSLNGRAQNRHEVECYQEYGDHRYIPRFHDWDRKTWRWVEVEYLETTFDQDLIPLKKDITAFVRGRDLRLDECRREDHWGLDWRGNPKLLDMGAAKRAYW